MGPKEACGVFGIFAPTTEVARTTFFGLYALQHRGQESAGIASTDGRRAYVHRGMGLVTQVFNEEAMATLRGSIAIGHTRYSTTGASHLRNAQPYVIETLHGPLGIAHNGNLTNAHILRRALLERGVGLSTSTDSETIIQMLAQPLNIDHREPRWEARLRSFMDVAEGAFSLAILTRDAIFAVRDPSGFRPLCLGELTLDDGHRGYVVASESCALGTAGATFIREVEPGEIVRIDQDGIHSWPMPLKTPKALCVFEYVYFARPDSNLEGQSIHSVRQRMGELLAEESAVEADVVIGVPDSAIPAAIGYSRVSGVPYIEGLIKNRYIGRTFIQPDDRLRRDRARLKYNPLPENLSGKRVVLVDDSIVRGNTAGPIVSLLRSSGAAEVHFRVSSPPVRHPCFMGVDMGTYEELIANEKNLEEIRNHIGADSLAYLSHGGMMRAVSEKIGEGRGHCSACFSGNYPLELHRNQEGDKLAFEGISGQ